MDGKFNTILDSLPPKPPASKLEPYAELIGELRKRDRSYREIAGILKQRCGLSVGLNTLYRFVMSRCLDTSVSNAQAGENRRTGNSHQEHGTAVNDSNSEKDAEATFSQAT
ncbi:MAG TPA: hypothetical protein VGM43_18700 [Bryobacteraceae bacterium]|jgi:hypothetical protein